MATNGFAMSSRSKRAFWLFLIIVALLIPIVSGMTELLLFELPWGLPLGTLLAATSLLLAACILLILAEHRWSQAWAMAMLLASGFWWPLGAWLAGNPRLSFSGSASHSTAFWSFTLYLGITLLLSLLIASVWRLIRWYRVTAAGEFDN
jgi:hypothetical protein